MVLHHPLFIQGHCWNPPVLIPLLVAHPSENRGGGITAFDDVRLGAGERCRAQQVIDQQQQQQCGAMGR